MGEREFTVIREYRRILLADLPAYEADGWTWAQRDGELPQAMTVGGTLTVILVWRACNAS